MAIISLKKNLVYKIPVNLIITQNSNDQYIAKIISLEVIESDEWLKKDINSFTDMIKSGHIGVVIFDKVKQTVAARGFIAINGAKPNHIPKIPKDTAWLHYQAVKDAYQGQGLQKELIMFSVQLINKINNKIDIYLDTDVDNIPSRINQKKLQLIEAGIYTVIKIGTQRIRFGYILLGLWNKKKKHPAIIDDASLSSKEKHKHFHIHEEITHVHKHKHNDNHHNHSHILEIRCAHCHVHTHERIEHTHIHETDMHHNQSNNV